MCDQKIIIFQFARLTKAPLTLTRGGGGEEQKEEAPHISDGATVLRGFQARFLNTKSEGLGVDPRPSENVLIFSLKDTLKRPRYRV